MVKIKVLWFCNVDFSARSSKNTGSWLFSMANALSKNGMVDLYSITHGDVSHVEYSKQAHLAQWVIPYSKLNSRGLPNEKTIITIQQLVNVIKPDLIHIWGTENYWGLLYTRGFISGNVLLEIQGFKYICSRYFFHGMSFMDIIKCFSIKEFFKPSTSILGLKNSFRKWEVFEKEIIKNCNNISAQSEWSKVHVKSINYNANIFNSKIALRNEFVNSEKWDIEKCNPFEIFTTLSNVSISYKGLHILFDAIGILKSRYPKIKLFIAGEIPARGIRTNGYFRWLLSKAKKNGIEDSIVWLGSLNANSLIKQLRLANVVVIPSFVESYSLALDEALEIGVPTVVSFSGAMPERVEHEKNSLLYQDTDIETCANAISRILCEDNLAKKLSNNTLNNKYNKTESHIARNQIDIYNQLININ